MNFNIITTNFFARRLKQLVKKYPSLTDDLRPIAKELAQNPMMGTSLGKGCYKIRLAITSKGKGRSSGARLITYVQIVRNTVFLLSIYDKSEMDSLTEKEIASLMNLIE